MLAVTVEGSSLNGSCFIFSWKLKKHI